MRDRRPVVLAGAAAGVLLAALATLLQDDRYVADGSIAIVRQGVPPGSDGELARAAEAAAELFHSRAVAESAVANLRLEGPADELLERTAVEAEPDSSLVRIEVEAGSRDEARRAAQEVAEISTVLFNDRFGPGTLASIWEAPRAAEDRVSPDPARNLALGALLGAVLASVLGLRGRSRAPARPSEPAPVPQLDERIAALTRRELELARRAAALAVREREGASAPPPPPGLVPEPASEPEPEPEPESKPEAERAPEPFVEPRVGDWTVADVERLLAAHGDEFPELREELGFYLESFRDVAGARGRLPGGVEVVAVEVFGPLLERARSAAAP